MRFIAFKKAFLLIQFFSLFALLSMITACVKGEFDEPVTGGEDPKDITTDQIVSLDVVLDKWVSGQYIKIDLEKYVQAVVIADDKTGNIYKTLMFQDESGDKAISVLVDDVNLYNQYPIGRRVFINLKDLWISDYNGLPQLGYGPYFDNGEFRMAGIPANLVGTNLRKGVLNITIEPLTLKINQLGESALNKLIRLENVEFKAVSAGKTFANVPLGKDISHSLKSCDGSEIIVRTSSHANFAGELTPTGNGDLIAIYTIFGTTKQLTIRSLSELSMNNPRCDGTTGGTGGEITISSVRTALNNGGSAAPIGFIKGVVISDRGTGVHNPQNMYIQDASGGILVRFASTHTFDIGDELEIEISGLEILNYRNLAEINNVPIAQAVKVGTMSLPLKEVTVKEVLDNMDTYESTRIKIINASISGGATYSGTRKVTDGSGTIDLYTSSFASFANQNVPSGKVSMTVIVSDFTSGPQILLNTANDVQ